MSSDMATVSMDVGGIKLAGSNVLLD